MNPVERSVGYISVPREQTKEAEEILKKVGIPPHGILEAVVYSAGENGITQQKANLLFFSGKRERVEEAKRQLLEGGIVVFSAVSVDPLTGQTED